MKLQEGEKDGVNLSGEFSSGRDDDGGDVVFLGWFIETEDFLHERKEKGESFAATCDSLYITLDAFPN